MKKISMVIVLMFAVIGYSFAAGGAYISKITADSKGLTIDSKGDIYLKSAGKITIAPATSYVLNGIPAISQVATTTVAVTSGTTMTLTGGSSVTIRATTTQSLTSGTTQTITAGTSSAISAGTNLTLSAAKSVTISSTTEPVYYGMVSGAAGADAATGFKIVKGYTAAKADGINVTLTADAIFSSQYSYQVFVTEYGSAATQPTAGCRVQNVDGSHFTISGDASSTYNWMAIGN